MKIVKLDNKEIVGLSIRTTNAREMNPETAKIAALHQKFDQVSTVDYANGARVYGIYFDYESDASGKFSVMSGTDQIDVPATETLEKISIGSGDYMVFEATGEIPGIVIDTWGDIWKHFENSSTLEQRAYTTDFEFYRNENTVEIYIAIKAESIR